jgi:YVTN family beta-propeller protein
MSAHRLSLARVVLAALGPLAGSVGVSACYSDSAGIEPPSNALYFPTGLAVSRGGGALYVVNSDFDLRYNGGTLQSYDLTSIRRHAALTILDPQDPELPLVRGPSGACSSAPPAQKSDGSGARQPLGETCAPPVDSTHYVRDSAVVSAFANDLAFSASKNRLFFPVSGNASVMWADVEPDDSATAASSTSFTLGCGTRTGNRCDDGHQAGASATEAGNTRGITLPGQPFGLAFTEDGTGLALTHQADTIASLLSTGLSATGERVASPALQFLVGDVPSGSTGIALVPHDADAFDECIDAPTSAACLAVLPKPAFLKTSKSQSTLALLRYYADEGGQGTSSLHRPYLTYERAYNIASTSVGIDARGIAIDASARIACKAQAALLAGEARRSTIRTCARLPARVFIANRSTSPSYGALLVGEVGATAADGSYDADAVRIVTTVPLLGGPSRVHLAPIVDADGRYSLRVYVVAFDSNRVSVVNPETLQVEATIVVGQGPFAMAFDPFAADEVARRDRVPDDARFAQDPKVKMKRYRFGYIASFTRSYVQAIDLDNTAMSPTFERVVFTLGDPSTTVVPTK